MDDITVAHGSLAQFVSNANDVIIFKLIREEKDFDDDNLEFPPEYTHQFFGDNEHIFGYKGLDIVISYSASGLSSLYNMTYDEKVSASRTDGIEADDVLNIISKKLEMPLLTNVDTFTSLLSKETTFKPHGTQIHSFQLLNKQYKKESFNVYHTDMSVSGFRDYHERMQSFILWFIDAASFIDIDDEKWDYFTLYEEVPDNGNFRYYFIGYATVYRYYAYPTKVRPRVSQMLILPPFQKLGMGAELFHALSRWYIQDSDVLDITVEDPSESFTRLRDFIDCKNCLNLLNFTTSHLVNGFTEDMASEAQEKLKLCKRQARRVYEILRLRCTNKADKRAYRNFRLEVKRRLNAPFQRQKMEMEKLKNTLSAEELKAMVSCTTEQRFEQLERLYTDLETEYYKVVERLAVS